MKLLSGIAVSLLLLQSCCGVKETGEGGPKRYEITTMAPDREELTAGLSILRESGDITASQTVYGAFGPWRQHLIILKVTASSQAQFNHIVTLLSGEGVRIISIAQK